MGGLLRSCLLPVFRAMCASSALRLPLPFWSPAGLALCLLLDAAFSKSSLTAACFLLGFIVKLVIWVLHGDVGGGAFLFAAVCECGNAECLDDEGV